MKFNSPMLRLILCLCLLTLAGSGFAQFETDNEKYLPDMADVKMLYVLTQHHTASKKAEAEVKARVKEEAETFKAAFKEVWTFCEYKFVETRKEFNELKNKLEDEGGNAFFEFKYYSSTSTSTRGGMTTETTILYPYYMLSLNTERLMFGMRMGYIKTAEVLRAALDRSRRYVNKMDMYCAIRFMHNQLTEHKGNKFTIGMRKEINNVEVLTELSTATLYIAEEHLYESSRWTGKIEKREPAEVAENYKYKIRFVNQRQLKRIYEDNPDKPMYYLYYSASKGVFVSVIEVRTGKRIYFEFEIGGYELDDDDLEELSDEIEDALED